MSKKISELTEVTSSSIDLEADYLELSQDVGGTPVSKRVNIANLLRSDLGWFNVKAYGATGNGTTDDTTAISNAVSALNTAGGGVLYFPRGTYLTSGGFTITTPFMVLGCGCANQHDGGDPVSEVRCNSTTAVLFTINTTTTGLFRDIALKNVAGSTPTAGSAILVATNDATVRVDYEHISVWRFYDNIDVQVGSSWAMNGCVISAPVRYGIRVRNTVTNDAGDWHISNTAIYSGIQNSTAAIRIESSGGGQICNVKINAVPGGYEFTDGIQLVPAGTTSILLVSNSSIENVSGQPVNFDGATSISYDYIKFMNCQFASSAGQNAINITCGAVGELEYITILACMFVSSGSTVPAISMTKVNQAIIGACQQTGHSAIYGLTDCTNITTMDETAA